MQSPAAHGVFREMSISYRSIFIKNIIQSSRDNIDCLTTICEELVNQPYSMYYYTVFIDSFTKDLGEEDFNGFVPSLEDALTKIQV